MFICLSSGATPRYRQDVLRAIAIPRGGTLQFRYAQKYITEDVKAKMRDGTCRGAKALIAYVDQSDRAHEPLLIPCRFAAVIKTELHGTTATIEFELGQFAYARDLEAFNSQVRSVSGGVLPSWEGAQGQYPKGAYAIDVATESVTNVVAASDLSDWEKIVEQLASRPDFTAESCFYMVDGLRSVDTEEVHVMQNGTYNLKPSCEYELCIYHYLPTSSTHTTYLHLLVGKPSVEFLTSPTQAIDSRYDMKRIRFRTGCPVWPENVVCSLHKADSPMLTPPSVFDFDVRMSIAGTYCKLLFWGICVGFLLATPHIINTISGTGSAKVFLCSVYVIVGIITGVLAAFKLRTGV